MHEATRWNAVVVFLLSDGLDRLMEKAQELATHEFPAHIMQVDRDARPHRITMRVGVMSDAAADAAREVAAWIEGTKALLELLIDPASISIHRSGVREQIPRLVGLADIAKEIGLSRQRVKQISDSDSKFPKPMTRTSAGPLYSFFEVMSWHKSRQQQRSDAQLGANDLVTLARVPFGDRPPEWLEEMYTYPPG